MLLSQFLGFDPGVGEDAKNEAEFDTEHEITKKWIELIIEYTNIYKNEIKTLLLK